MIRVIHVVANLGKGGAARAVLAAAKYSSRLDKNFQHEVAALLSATTEGLAIAQQAGIKVHVGLERGQLLELMAKADIVQIEWWNSPAMTALLNADLPAMRLLLWLHVVGDTPPQVITKEVLELADVSLTTCSYSYQLPIVQEQLQRNDTDKIIDMVLAGTDFERLHGLKPRQHSNFNVGYIGMVDFVKLHPNFIPMSASVDRTGIRFIVCGDGLDRNVVNVLREQAAQLGKSAHFEFKGYVHDLNPVIEQFDAYGYPLCEITFGSAELNLQEVMFAGIPVVMFPHGGVRNLVVDGVTGFIVRDELEYKQAIEFLYDSPSERRKLGENARRYAREHFGAENWAGKLNAIYQQTMTLPKRTRNHLYPALQRGPRSDAPGGYEHRAAEWFARSRGDFGQMYLQSMQLERVDELLEVERQIAESARMPIMVSNGYGSVFHYRNYFPDDAYLRLWAGLLLREIGRYSDAINELESALQLGLRHPTLPLYLQELYGKVGTEG